MMNWCGYEWENRMEGDSVIHTGQPWMWYNSSDAVVDKNGTLHLCIEKNPKEIKYRDGRIFHPEMSVGLIRTCKPFGYGTFSAEIKMPKGTNLWPSFWLSGDKHWPPEIDIAEYWSRKGKCFDTFVPYPPYLYPSWRTTTNVHYKDIVDSAGTWVDGTYQKKSIGSKNIPLCKQPENPTDNFIEYKCEWFPDSIKFYANGKLVRKVGKDIAHKLVDNIPDDRYHMDAILNFWCEDPSTCKVEMETEMLVKDFRYAPFES